MASGECDSQSCDFDILEGTAFVRSKGAAVVVRSGWHVLQEPESSAAIPSGVVAYWGLVNIFIDYNVYCIRMN